MQYTLKLFIFLLLFTIFFSANAQENTTFTQFYTNLYVINPSYAGIDGQPHLSIGYRNQWAGFEGSPKQAMVTFHMPYNHFLDWGGMIVNDNQGPINTTSALGTFGYTVILREHHTLTMAMSAGVSSINLDTEGFDFTDPALANAMDNSFGLIGNAGISYRANNLMVGISLPGLFTTQNAFDASFNVGSPALAGGLLLNVSDRFYFQRGKMAFEPHLVYRYYLNNPGQVELGALMHFHHKAWAGLSYRQGQGLAAMLGLKYQDKYLLSYSYGVRNLGENAIPYSSHEIQLDFLLGKRHKDREYISFVDSHKPKRVRKIITKHTAQHTKPKGETSAKKPETDAKKDTTQPKEDTKKTADNIKKEDPKPIIVRDTVRVVVHDTVRVSVNQQKPAMDSVATPLTKPVESKKQPRFQTNQGISTSQQVADSINNAMREAKEKRVADSLANLSHEDQLHHSIINNPRFSQFLLSKGDYVVKRQFDTFHDALQYSDDLFTKGYDSEYGYYVQTRKWYVYTIKTSDRSAAEKEKARLLKNPLFKDVFILEIKD